MGQSSSISGYASGRTPPTTFSNVIQKFPFASDANATDVGDLQVTRDDAAGSSSTASGYVVGGQPGSNGNNIIEKFPFAADANSTDVGDLVESRRVAAGQQV